MREAHFPVGVTTGIGSLPHDDPVEAVQHSFETHPLLPAAPSLPRRSAFEGMITQGAWGIPGVMVLDDGSLLVDEAAVNPAEPLSDPGIDGEPFVGLRTFLTAIEGREAPFKLQLTGPVTLGLALHALGVNPERAFAVAERAVAARIDAALQAARKAAPDGLPVLFVDEPGLCAALHPGFPLPLDDALDLVSSAMATVQRSAVAGLHCCGRADWHAVLQAGPQVLSLPVGTGIVDHAGALTDFLEAGGWVAWGAVPTDGPFTRSVDMLWRRLLTEWGQLVAAGCDPVLLRDRAIITPACGLVGMDAYQLNLIARLTTALGHRLAGAAGSPLHLGA
jgi:methionine synthase II (cobalamin-independent)